MVDKVKAFILVENLRHLLLAFKESANGDEDTIDFQAKLKNWYEESLFSFSRSEILTKLTSRERVEICW